jgi:hypothetical protein
MGAGMQTQTATATTTNGDQVTVSMPDYAAQRRAQADTSANLEAVQSSGRSLIEGGLARNTLDPGEKAIGKVYFARQKKGQILVRIVLGDAIFEFPFDAHTKE